MKRFPNGVAAPPFYQHRAPDVPPGVRIEVVSVVAAARRRSSAATLKTLLYTTQLAAISQDPVVLARRSTRSSPTTPRSTSIRRTACRSRACSTSRAGFATSSTRSARSACRRPPAPTGCTSTSRCRRGRRTTPGCSSARSSPRVVAQKHPKVATVERTVRARGARVYIDCLQNILGKTLATAYSARASDYAGVSTPLTWKKSTRGSTAASSRSGPFRRDWQRLATCGRR